MKEKLVVVTICMLILTATSVVAIETNSFESIAPHNSKRTIYQKSYIDKKIQTNSIKRLKENKNLCEPGVILAKIQSDIDISTHDKTQIFLEALQNKNPDLSSVENVSFIFETTQLKISDNSCYGLDRWVKIHTDTFNVENEVREWEQLPEIELAQPNYIATLCLEPNDPYYHTSGSWNQNYKDLYGMHNIDTAKAWDICTGSHDVVVGVIDTGIDYTHEDIVDNIWINEDEVLDGTDTDNDGFVDNIYGANYAYNNGDPKDDHGHGTHCSGTIAGMGNNSVGVVGVNWHAQIMGVKGFSSSGSAYTDTLAKCLRWAVDNGAQVVSNSWSYSSRVESVPVIESAVRYVHNKGCVVVFAAGNANDDVSYYTPQNMDETIVIAATDYNDKKASFSNWGELVDVAAPGVSILSLEAEGTSMGLDVGENYTVASGTSMACPHAAGLVALLLANNPALKPDMIKTILKHACDEVSSSVPIGRGRINAYDAIIRDPVIANLDKIVIESDPIVDITGSAWSEDFEYYTVSYTKRGVSEWIELVNSTETVIDGVLCTFDTSVLSSAKYEVYLKVKTQKYLYSDKEIVLIGGYEQFIVDSQPINYLVDYTSIQDAIDNASDGYRIFVRDGIYRESITIDKEIELIGENRTSTIIDGMTKGHAVGVYCDKVTVTGFGIQNGQKGVYVNAVSDVLVTNNNIKYNDQNVDDQGLNTQWYTQQGGNFWDDYDGEDKDGDCIGDTPYQISGSNAEDKKPLISSKKDPTIVPQRVIVDDDFDQTTPGFGYDKYEAIHDAIVSVKNGGTIVVKPGYYHEVNSPIWKTITIVGEDRDTTIVDGWDKDSILYIIAENVSIMGLTIQNTGTRMNCGDDITELAAIYCAAHNTFIAHNHIQNARVGISLSGHHRNDRERSNYNVITRNVIGPIFYMGVFAYASDYNIFSGNTFYQNYRGITLLNSERNVVVQNKFVNNSRGGLWAYEQSCHNIITENIVDNNQKYGLAIECENDWENKHNNTLSKNLIRNNLEYGIWYIDTAYNPIIHNKIEDNGIGVMFYTTTDADCFTSRCEVTENIIQNNDVGVETDWDTYKNKVHYNNFINNQCNAWSRDHNLWNEEYPLGGNYWDDYNGSDNYSGPGQNETGSDGIGDTPYEVEGYYKPSENDHDHYPLINPITWSNNPPNQPNKPIPEDEAISSLNSPLLSWIGGDPDPDDSTTYDVFFGTTTTPSKVVDNIDTPFYQTNNLKEATTYYWKVVSKDSMGQQNESNLWQFVTPAQYKPEQLNISNITGGIGLSLSISNTGEDTIHDINWSCEINNGLLLLPLGRQKTGHIQNLEPDESVNVRIFLFGLGRVTITLQATTDSTTIQKTATAFVFFPFVVNPQLEIG